MPAPMVAPLPPALDLDDGYIVRFAALDPTTGATVANVTVSAATLQVVNLSGSDVAALQSGPFILVPGPSA